MAAQREWLSLARLAAEHVHVKRKKKRESWGEERHRKTSLCTCMRLLSLSSSWPVIHALLCSLLRCVFFGGEEGKKKKNKKAHTHMSTALFKSQSPPFSFLSSQTHTYLRGSSDGGLRCDGKFSTQLSHKTRRYKQGRKKKGDEERNGKLKKDEREEKKKSYGGQRLLFTRPPQFWDSRLTCFFFF